MYPQASFSKFAFTHSPVRAKPQFKFQKHNTGMANHATMMNIANNNGKNRAAVFDGIRIIQDLRAVTGMCGACK